MKTVGIIGGLGPDTTAKVYVSIINKIYEAGIAEYPPITIYNLPFPRRIEHEAIVQGIHAEKMLPYLISGARVLEKAGADFGILPCNTLHAFISDIRNSVNIPFLSILDETVTVVHTLGIRSIAILASETSVRADVYGPALAAAQIQYIYPGADDQAIVNHIIVDILNGNRSKDHGTVLGALCDSLYKSGADAVLLACTDLQHVIPECTTDVRILDTTEILIAAAVRTMTR